MTNLGYDPKKKPSDQPTPSGIGLLAADTVLEYRHHDGANQLGDLHPGAYSDYTGYATANTPDLIRDSDHWQPLIEEGNGKSYPQAFYMPQWGRVVWLGICSRCTAAVDSQESSVRPGGLHPSGQRSGRTSNNLNERQKATAEYWELSQGPGTNFILCNQFAQFVVHRDSYHLDDQVKLFFALNNAMFDTSIAAWDAKRYLVSGSPLCPSFALVKRL
jgi:hypothetical protein